jgi:GNAT superfamily N-acetyltransferase
MNKIDCATLRQAGPADAAALALIGAASFLETFAGALPDPAMSAFCRRHHSIAAWQQQLAEPGATAWLAEATGGAPIGYALLTDPHITGQRAGDAELRRLYTLSRWHAAGAGAALLQAAQARATENGAQRLLLGVFASNERAIAFYRKSGFEPIGTWVFMVGDLACNDLVLAKSLR